MPVEFYAIAIKEIRDEQAENLGKNNAQHAYEKVNLPKRQPKGDYVEPDHPFRPLPKKY